MDYLVIFHTYSGVIKFEKELTKMNMTSESMPAPRYLSVDCGVAIKFSTKDTIEEMIQSISTQNIYKIFKITATDYEVVYINE
jgi:hypothetical protein